MRKKQYTPRPVAKRQPKLTDRMFRVVSEYFTNGFDQKQALLAAGYSETTATGNPQAIFDKPAVRIEIVRRHALADKKVELSKEWIVSRLMKLATSGEVLSQYKKVTAEGLISWDFKGAPEHHLALVQGLMNEITSLKGERLVTKFKIDTADQLAVLNSLARIEGLFQDRLTLTDDDGVVAALQAGRDRVRQKKEETIH